MTSNKVDFLSQPSPARVKKEIQNICDSYNHPWDFLSEVCQNSVDAINIHKKLYGQVREHKVNLRIDARDRSVKISDTGVGFNKNLFLELLAPHGTDKLPGDSVIGQKGVGLTYTIFTSNKYLIETKSIAGHIKGSISNAAAWKNSSIEAPPSFEFEINNDTEFDPQDTFTEVSLIDIENIYSESDDVFNQTTRLLELILRSKTAIGYTKGIFDSAAQLDIQIKLEHIDKSGVINTIDLMPVYVLPNEFLGKNDVVNLPEFKNIAATLSDDQKTKKLQGKCLFKIGAEYRAGRNISYFCFFAPSRNLYKEISEKNGFLAVDESGEWESQFNGGIFIATKGMPTGIRLEPPRGGEMGYWPNFFLLIEDDSINFDLGRKAVPARTAGLLREIAKGLFSEFRPFIEYVRTEPPVKSTNSTIQHYEKARRFDIIKEYANIGLDKINIIKHPNGQEAAVVALFHELVGADLLKGYYTYEIGYKMTYDFWGVYKIDSGLIAPKFGHLAKNGVVEIPMVAEFKYNGEDILDDFESDTKFFNDIDLIVCWDLDETKFAKKSVTVEPLGDSDRFYFGSNYILSWPGSYNLGAASEKHVLALRPFITELILKSK